MRQVRWASWLGAVAITLGFGGLNTAAADLSSERAAAILTYPLILVDTDEGNYEDTAIQLSNTSNEPVNLHCFYENANYHCTNTGEVCTEPDQCVDGGRCVPGWNETDFRIRLTPLQPIGWLASDGATVCTAQDTIEAGGDECGLRNGRLAINGVDRQGSDGSSNAGSRIPPVAEDPFVGLLKCIVVDDAGVPVDRNVVKGEATLIAPGSATIAGDPDDITLALLDEAKYNAVGIQAIDGAVNDDKELVLGGPEAEAEYNGCPNVIILNHFFDLVQDPATDALIGTQLVLAPCTEDFLRQLPGSAVVQFLVYNEFEQRFSTSTTVECLELTELSLIDTTQPERSIFSAGVAGTVSGQTRMTPIGDGLFALALENHLYNLGPAPDADDDDVIVRKSGAYNVHFQGDREDSDLITLP